MNTIIKILFIILSIPAFSQDPLNSHFFLQLGNLNPSLAGSMDHHRYYGNYRNQYPGLSSAFVTYNAGFDMPVDVLHGGVGLNISNDVLAHGAFNTFATDLFYSYHFRASRDLYFKGGLLASINNKFSRAISLEDASPEVIPSRSAFMADFGAGISAHYNDLSTGFALHHMANTVLTGSEKIELPLKITFHGSYHIPHQNGYVIPSLIAQKQASAMHITYGGMYIYKIAGFGLWFRQDDRFRFSSINYAFRVDYKSLILVYSYDFPVHKIYNWSNFGAHEVTFLLKMKYNNVRKKKWRAVKCPRI